MPLMIKN